MNLNEGIKKMNLNEGIEGIKGIKGRVRDRRDQRKGKGLREKKEIETEGIKG